MFLSRAAGRLVARQSIRPLALPVALGLRYQHQGGPKPPSGDAPQADQPPSPPKQPLPDLRQGIPSTFAEEFLKQKSTGQSANRKDGVETPEYEQDQFGKESASGEAEAGSGRGGDGGEIPKSAYESSIDKKRNRYANYAYLSFVLLGFTGALWAGRNWDTEEEAAKHPDAPSGFGLGLMYARITARLSGRLGYYTEPAFPKLLPILKDQPLPPYTLVLSLDDLLIHSEWTREHGWRTAKRPDVDRFLLYLSQYYELCLFTSQPSAMADPLVRKLDPYHIIMWPLFREATRYENGDYVKDLSYLNRPLNRVILLDTKQSHAKAQPENAIILPAWKGDPNDHGLVALVPFLEHIAAMGIDDVRDAIASYEGTHIPTEFAAREKRMREALQSQVAARQKTASKVSGVGALAGSLGLRSSPQPTTEGGQTIVEGLAQGKLLIDLIREDGMKRYTAMEKEIRENGEKWLAEEQEMEKKLQAESMKDMKSKFFGFGGGSPPPEQPKPSS